MQKQRLFLFLSETRDHASIWSFLEFIPDFTHPKAPKSPLFIEDREGTEWLVSRDLFNTTEQARKMLYGFFDDKYQDTTIVALTD